MDHAITLGDALMVLSIAAVSLFVFYVLVSIMAAIGDAWSR